METSYKLTLLLGAKRGREGLLNYISRAQKGIAGMLHGSSCDTGADTSTI